VDHQAIAAIVAEYDAVGIVVGMPLSMSGAVGPAAQAVAQEVLEIGTTVAVEVDTVDERLTTVAAASALRRGGRRSRQQRPVIDKTAAAIILQTWLDRNTSLDRSAL
jgi:putative holliday junction resolvase